MKNRIFVILFLLNINLYSQKIDISIGSGFWGGTKFIEGYYTSSQIKIPISSILYTSIMLNSGESFVPRYEALISTNNSNEIYYLANKFNTKQNAINFHSFDLLLSVNAFKLFNINTNNELFIGTGYGFKTYTSVRIQYSFINQQPELLTVYYRRYRDFEPYFLNVNYNFKMKRIYLGLDLTINSIDGEGLLSYGIKIGSKL